MSMMGQFREVTPQLLARLRSQPSLTEAVVLADFGADPGLSDVDTLLSALPGQQREAMRAALRSLAPEQRAAMEAQMATAAAALRGVGEAVRKRAGGERPDGLGDLISLEKAWHGLHFLLCGSAEPATGELAQAVLGGTEIGADHGYGPARYLEPDAVRRIAATLGALSADELRRRYDAAAMEAAQVYPGGWDDAENVDWLLEAFQELARFYAGVADRGNAVLLYLS